ncbi:uncharacterized protein B0H18DRAFT_1094050 [Fomitopsis serialis]|uniref:uncharacterized protein n=1 Tax=Fomitopsis serialis TaxID=139415 RepID=UPI0020086121|nr:uncharacterized protein B0H18DRAFT_1094050 [Neoantrodia serialis]KAH9928839.1 hypothetical protein B0H18DRAFT_1094050 [Neoantrodia serialis]
MPSDLPVEWKLTMKLQDFIGPHLASILAASVDSDRIKASAPLCTDSSLARFVTRKMSPNAEMNKLHAVIAAPLDDKLYHLDADEITFYKQKTGIHDETVLKEHIVQVQHEAYEVFPYILKIARHPAYDQFLKVGREHDNAFFMDVGCCFGNDIRKAVEDGFPAKNCIGTDLQGEFWHLGYRLFKDSPEGFPVPFLQGDVLNPAFLDPSPPVYAPPDRAMIFGWHVGGIEKGLIKGATMPNGDPLPMFCHCPQSWKELWDGEIFDKGTVAVKAELKELETPPGVVLPRGAKFWQLVWSVTRL